jgi:hypothetical protein
MHNTENQQFGNHRIWGCLVSELQRDKPLFKKIHVRVSLSQVLIGISEYSQVVDFLLTFCCHLVDYHVATTLKKPKKVLLML